MGLIHHDEISGASKWHYKPNFIHSLCVNLVDLFMMYLWRYCIFISLINHSFHFIRKNISFKLIYVFKPFILINLSLFKFHWLIKNLFRLLNISQNHTLYHSLTIISFSSYYFDLLFILKTVPPILLLYLIGFVFTKQNDHNYLTFGGIFILVNALTHNLLNFFHLKTGLGYINLSFHYLSLCLYRFSKFTTVHFFILSFYKCIPDHISMFQDIKLFTPQRMTYYFTDNYCSKSPQIKPFEFQNTYLQMDNYYLRIVLTCLLFLYYNEIWIQYFSELTPTCINRHLIHYVNHLEMRKFPFNLIELLLISS